MTNPWVTATLMLLCALGGYCARLPWISGDSSSIDTEPLARDAATDVVAKASKVTTLPGPVMLTGGTFIDAMGEEFVQLAGGPQARIVIIPTAWETIEQEGYEQFYDQWKIWQPASIEVLHTRDRREANDSAFVQKLRTATGVWFTGGNQTALVDAYQGTLVQEELRNLLERGGAIGANCAGAMAIGELMIIRGKEPVDVRPGLWIVPGLVADSHWLERNRIERLREVIEENPGHFGIGIDKQTAVVLRGGQMRVIGLSYATTVTTALDPEGDEPPEVRLDVWAQGDAIRLNPELARFEDVGWAHDRPAE